MKLAFNNRLQHPIFILSIVLLLLNDFFLKYAIGNAFTGKLSDFTGLFAFPYFFSCIFPNWKKIIHIFTGLIFIWWKSVYSQPFIDFLNYSRIPVTRVIDLTDNISLVSIFISYFIISRNIEYKRIRPIQQFCIVVLALFSFMATSLAPRTMVNYTSVDKIYQFDMPIERFITRFNMLQQKEIKRMLCKDCNWGTFDEETGVFYSKNRDTLAYIIDINKHSYKDTVSIRNYLADFQIYSKNDSTTILKLINIATSVLTEKTNDIDSANLFPNKGKYNYPVRSYVILSSDTTNTDKLQKKAIDIFEKKVIRKLK